MALFPSNPQEARLDATDIRIILALRENARLPVAELARHVGLSPQSVADRMRRLEYDQVIVAYKAELNLAVLGYNTQVLLRIRPAPGSTDQARQLIEASPQILACYRVTDENCFVALMVARGARDLEDTMEPFIPYAQTSASMILKKLDLPDVARLIEREQH